MIGAIYFVPLFVQAVIGQTAASSGVVLLPMLLAMIVTSTLSGQLISRTGRYKLVVVFGVATIGAGYVLLSSMDAGTTSSTVARNLVVVGIGLGMAMQTFVLIVQNAVPRADLGAATSAMQMFRSIGSAVGVTVMGTLLTSGMAAGIPRHLPASALRALQASGGVSALTSGSALDPVRLTQLPAAVQVGIRAGMADALHEVYLSALPFLALALLAALLLREIPLRRSVHTAEPAWLKGAAAAESGAAEAPTAGPELVR